MQKIVAYRAFYGLEYDTEEECRAHEKEEIKHFYDYCDKVQFFDKNLYRYNISKQLDIEQYVDTFIKICAQAAYILVMDGSVTTYGVINHCLGYSFMPDIEGWWERRGTDWYMVEEDY